MIRAMIFDLDGTLVQTERLKAQSYAQAAIDLCPDPLDEAAFHEAYKQVVGLSRREVAQFLLDKFHLAETAAQQMDEFGVDAPWQAYVQIRLRHYEKMLEDSEVLRNNQWPHNVALLRQARASNCAVGLATMSYCPQVRHVLNVLEFDDLFDFVASRDDVEHDKPDPEIYNLVAAELHVAPHEALVIEDSATGVQAALGAKMWCIAVATPYTQASLHNSNLLEPQWIVDDPDTLPTVVERMLTQRHSE